MCFWDLPPRIQTCLALWLAFCLCSSLPPAPYPKCSLLGCSLQVFNSQSLHISLFYTRPQLPLLLNVASWISPRHVNGTDLSTSTCLLSPLSRSLRWIWCHYLPQPFTGQPPLQSHPQFLPVFHMSPPTLIPNPCCPSLQCPGLCHGFSHSTALVQLAPCYTCLWLLQ